MTQILHKTLEELSPQASRAAAEQIFAWLHVFFPAKSEVIGDECIRQAILAAFETAANYEIRNSRGVWLISTLTFALGTGFDSDPQYPWASQALSEESTRDPIVRTNRLYAGAYADLRRCSGVNTEVQA